MNGREKAACPGWWKRQHECEACIGDAGTAQRDALRSMPWEAAHRSFLETLVDQILDELRRGDRLADAHALADHLECRALGLPRPSFKLDLALLGSLRRVAAALAWGPRRRRTSAGRRKAARQHMQGFGGGNDPNENVG